MQQLMAFELPWPVMSRKLRKILVYITSHIKNHTATYGNFYCRVEDASDDNVTETRLCSQFLGDPLPCLPFSS